MKILFKMMLIVSGLVLVGCGGGGASTSSETGNVSVLEYKGKTQLATLDNETIKEFIENTNMSFADMIEVPDAEDISLSKKLSKIVQKSEKKANGSKSGSIDYEETTIDNVTKKINVIFKNFNDGDEETLDGKIVYLITVDEQESFFIKKMDLTIENFSIKDNEVDLIMHGTMKMRSNDNATKKTLTQNIVAKNNADDSMIKLENFITVLDGSDRAISYKGKLYDSQKGYIEVTTPVELSYDKEGTLEVGGEILYEGENATVRERITYDNSLRVETDYGKDGSVDEVEVYNAETLEIIPNRAPVVTIYFPQSIYTDTNMSEVKVDVYDPDLDGVTVAYEWKINGESKADSLSLDNGLFVKHDMLKLEVTATDDRVGDVKVSMQDKEQEVLNTAPIALIESNLTTIDIEALNFIEFNASGSTDVDGDPLTYQWEIYRYIDADNLWYQYDATWELIESNQYTYLYKVNVDDFMNEGNATHTIFNATSEGKYIVKCIVADNDMANSESNDINLTVNSMVSSVEEVNLTNDDMLHSIENLGHLDIDNNGLEDIIYVSWADSENFLNVSYQDSKRVYKTEKIKLNSKLDDGTNLLYFTGNFDGSHKYQMLMTTSQTSFINDESVFNHKLQFLSLERGNLKVVQDINISTIRVAHIADTNGDGIDDIIAYDTNMSKYVIYRDINNMDQRIVIDEDLPYSSSGAIQIVVDINNDGFKDIVFTPKIRKFYNDDYTEYSAYLGVTCLLQTPDNNYIKKYNEFPIIEKVTPSIDLNVRIYEAAMLDDKHFSVIVEDATGQQLYTFKLEENNLKHISNVSVRGIYIDKFFAVFDINKDGKKDLFSFGSGGNLLKIFIQKEDHSFYPYASFGIDSYMQLTDRFGSNVILGDIDNDGSFEIVTVNGENKFSYINLK